MEERVTLHKHTPPADVDKRLKEWTDKGYFFVGIQTAEDPEFIVYILSTMSEKCKKCNGEPE